MYSGIDSAVIVEQVIEKPHAHILFPQVRGVESETELIINQLIEEQIKGITMMQEWYDEETLFMEVSYEVKLNEKGLISLFFRNFAQIEHAAHPMTIVRSLTVDLNTGEEYELFDYFKNMSGHALKITNFILREVERKEITLIIDLKLIPDNHPYYLCKDGIVIYFQEGEIAPRSYGILEFTIPYTFLQSLFEIECPLERLL